MIPADTGHRLRILILTMTGCIDGEHYDSVRPVANRRGVHFPLLGNRAVPGGLGYGAALGTLAATDRA